MSDELRIKCQFDPPFLCRQPEQGGGPVVFNSPHSGNVYPDAFIAAAALDRATLRRSEDCFVDELFAHVVDLGCPLLAARFPRAYIDVNREAYELDPAMFAGALPAFVNTGSLRVAGGLGTIPRIVCENAEIYREKLTFAEAEARIEALYRPYHEALRSLMAKAFRGFGIAVLVDCHSMPSAVVRQFDGRRQPRPDIILGDRYGTSCAPGIAECMEQAFRRQGLHAVRNKPYAGGYITQSYGRPAQGVNAIQVEINRDLYMDERSQSRKEDDLARLCLALRAVTASLLDHIGATMAPGSLAAE